MYLFDILINSSLNTKLFSRIDSDALTRQIYNANTYEDWKIVLARAYLRRARRNRHSPMERAAAVCAASGSGARVASAFMAS